MSSWRHLPLRQLTSGLVPLSFLRLNHGLPLSPGIGAMVRPSNTIKLHTEDESIELQDLQRVLLPCDAERGGLVRRLPPKEDVEIGARTERGRDPTSVQAADRHRPPVDHEILPTSSPDPQPDVHFAPARIVPVSRVLILRPNSG